MKTGFQLSWTEWVLMADSVEVVAERLLQVIDEGRRTATYKLALLVALMDACAAQADADGHAPLEMHTRVLAHHVLRIYLPQARAYLAGEGDPLELRQITTKRSPFFREVLRLHFLAAQQRCRTIDEIARRIPKDYERCLDEVERTFARYPLRLLQVVGREPRPFLYDVDWGESVSLASLHREGGGSVRFRPGAGDQLLRLAPLLRPLIELHWTRMVAKINGINLEHERLAEHLFGADRVPFPKVLREGLADLQNGACFYCGNGLADRPQVDHFIPWSRWPNNAIENLVLADGCNGLKSDYLPAFRHVDGWAHRFVAQAADLASVAGKALWESDPHRTLGLTRSCFAHVPVGTPLWVQADEFAEDDPTLISARLADLPSR